MYHAISTDLRDQIIARIKDSKESVGKLALEYEISPKTIYTWLTKGSAGVTSTQLVVNKLVRENQQLKQIVGELLLEKKRALKL